MVYSKTVKTKAALNALALDTGASVAKGPKQFNAEKRRAAKPKLLEKNPDAVQLREPETPSPVSEPDFKILADQIAESSKTNAGILEGIREQISQIQLNSTQQIIAWDFDFIRDDNGYLEHIRADAEFAPKETLN